MTTQKKPIKYVVNNNLTSKAKDKSNLNKIGVKNIRICTKCIMAETNETMTFDEDGVCNICNSFSERDKWDSEKKEKELVSIIEKYRGKFQYDAIVPFSGGKDSAWVAYLLVKKYKMKILLVTYDSNFRRPVHLRNIDRLVRKLGVDHVTHRSDQKVIKKTMLEALKRKGDFCWFCHTGVVTFPVRAAIMYKTPLLIWGEPNSEYAVYTRYEINERRVGDEPEGNERSFNRMMNLGVNAEDMFGFIDGVDQRDMEPYRFPNGEELEGIQKAGFRNICLGDYHEWDPIKQIKILEDELGWEASPVEGLHGYFSGEKVECYLQGARDYLRYIKRGYSRSNQRSNAEIRRGVLTRDEALEMAEYDARVPASLKTLLEFLDITEEEFNEIAMAQTISPWYYDSENAEVGPKLPDQDYWETELNEKY